VCLTGAVEEEVRPLSAWLPCKFTCAMSTMLATARLDLIVVVSKHGGIA